MKPLEAMKLALDLLDAITYQGARHSTVRLNLKEAIAELEAQSVEPVAWSILSLISVNGILPMPTFTCEKPEESDFIHALPLYTHPAPTAARVPMTKEQINTVLSTHYEVSVENDMDDSDWEEVVGVVRAIEAHHGITGEAK